MVVAVALAAHVGFGSPHQLAQGNSASRRFINSGVSFSTTPSAFMFSVTCSGRVAPVSTFLQGYFLGQVTNEVYRRTAWIVRPSFSRTL